MTLIDLLYLSPVIVAFTATVIGGYNDYKYRQEWLADRGKK